MIKYLLFILSLTLPLAVSAEDGSLPPELAEFGILTGALPLAGDKSDSPKTTKASRTKEIIPVIASSLPEAAKHNIQNPEQVFCYTLQKQPKDYTGYTLDNFALTGFCGELNTDIKTTTYEALFTNGTNILNVQSNCRIEPRIMLRFVKGVDYTDVLLSSPCPSFTVFYAGKIKAFNVKQGIIDDLVKMFEKGRTDFHSPALLKQTVANGTAGTAAEIELLEKNKQQKAPVMNWKTEEDEKKTKTETNTIVEPTAPKGWGNLNLKLKKQTNDGN